MVLEPAAEPVFHPDSYGYRPGRSALHAVAKARRRCWENDWVIDMDIRAFFDTVPWDLVLRAVKHHSREPWVLLYVKRWLEAPLQLPDGTITERTMGTPQGSAISPLLATVIFSCITRLTRGWPGPTRPSGLRSKYFRCSRGCDESGDGGEQVFVVFGFADGGGDAVEAELAA